MSVFDPVAGIETAITDRITAAFTDGQGMTALKKVEPIEVPIDPATEKTFQLVPPAIYITPLNARPGQTSGALVLSFGIYCVSARATSRTRTRGGAGTFGIGSYAMMIRTALTLRDWTPPVECAGRLELIGVENLSGLVFVRQKTSCWALTIACQVGLSLDNPHPGPIAGDPDGADLGDFLLFHTDWDVPPHEDAPEQPLPAALDAASLVEPQS